MVDIKLSFTDYLFCNYITLIKQCKIHYIKLGKALLFLRNLTIFLENWKFWWVPTTTRFNIFCWNFSHFSYFSVSTNRFSRSFYYLGSSFLLRSCVIDQPGLCDCIETRLFYFGKKFKIWAKWNKSQAPFWRYWEVEILCKIWPNIIK